MKCEDFERKFLETGLDENLNRHVKECAECAEFAKFADQATRMSSEKIQEQILPAELDFAIKSHAHAKSRSLFPPFLLHKQFISFAAAASFLVISSVLFLFVHKGEKVSEIGKRNAKTTIKWEEVDLTEKLTDFSLDLDVQRELVRNSSILDEIPDDENLSDFDIFSEISI